MSSGRRIRCASVIVVLVTGSITTVEAQATAESPDHRQVQSLIDQGLYVEAEAAARALVAKVEARSGPGSLQAARALDFLVEALGRRGKFGPETLELADRALSIREKRLGPEHPDVFNSRRIVRWYQELQSIRSLIDERQYAEAETGARALLAATELAEGRESLGVARALDLLGEALGRRQAPGTESLQAAERALTIREKQFAPEHPEVSRSLHLVGLAHTRRDDYAAAQLVLERAVAIAEKAFGPEDARIARPLSSLAEVHWRLGDYDTAEQLYRRILRIQEIALGAEDLEVAPTATGLGNVLQDLGRYEESKAFYERALSIREKRLGPTHPDVALTLNNLAVLLRTTGNLPQAKAAYERALTINEAALGPEHPNVALNLNNLGFMAREAGEFAESRALLDRALAIVRKAFGEAHLQVAGTLERIAELEMDIGDYAAAKRLYRESLSIVERTIGDNPSWRATKLSGLGWALLGSGELEESRQVLEQALEARQKAFGSDHFLVAGGLDDLAAVNVRLHDYSTAVKHAERAVSITEATMGPEHPHLGQMLVTLGTARVGAGDVLAARPVFERAVAIFEQALGREHPVLTGSLLQLAEANAVLGEEEAAFDGALRAASIGRSHFQLTGRSLTERQALAFASTSPISLDLALTLAVDQPATLSAARSRTWDALVRSRALVLDEIAARHRTSAGEDRQVLELAKTLAAARKRLADVVVRGPEGQASDAYLDLVDAARAEKERAERALAERSSSFRVEQERAQLGMTEVAAALPAGSALIAFVRYAHLDLVQREPGETPREAVPSYAAFVVRSGEVEPELVSLGPAAEVETLVTRWHDTIAQEGLATGRSRRTEGAYRSVGMALKRIIWEPLEGQLAGARRVFVVPDGALHFVNLAALPVGGDRYLIESGPVMHYLSAERDLVPREATREGEGLLAVGAPAFDDSTMFAALAPPQEPLRLAAASSGGSGSTVAGTYRGPRSACGSFTSMSFEPLPAAGRETEEIAALWNAAADPHPPPTTSSTARVLTGAAANEAAVKEQARGKRILHLATHGFFLGGDCASALDAAEREPGASMPTVIGENPLLLAGLAMAGANHRAAAGVEEEDGILTAEEIATLDLEGVDWAVLSACDTGIGELKASEGVFGLRRAFQVAGAKTVLMSLWAVEDAATRAWMTILYRDRLTRKLSTADAIHEASLAVLRERRSQRQSTHPFYWAGFVAVGDWR